MRKVAKFGGSSLADAGQFQKVKNIVLRDPTIQVIVVSAPGRRFAGDTKVTDMLYLCHAHLQYGVGCEDLLSQVQQRYQSIKEELGLQLDIAAEFDAIRAGLSRETPVDELVSRGEYLNAKLMAEYLGYPFMDATDAMFFDYEGKLDLERCYAVIAQALDNNIHLVIPGFYGKCTNGAIKTFSRGGSDITGAVAAAAVEADVYENWTDVSGILMADPRLVPDPLPIRRITYNELREMAFMGAEVLHEESIFPVREHGIPIHIRSTEDPDGSGTLIQELFAREDSRAENSPIITGITGRRDFTIVTVRKHYTDSQTEVMCRVLEVFRQFRVSVEHISAGIDHLSLVVRGAQFRRCMDEVMEEIRKSCHPESVGARENIALMAVVGRRMAAQPGVSGMLCAALGEEGINIRMIFQEHGDINIIVGVENKDFDRAVQVVYDRFVKQAN